MFGLPSPWRAPVAVIMAQLIVDASNRQGGQSESSERSRGSIGSSADEAGRTDQAVQIVGSVTLLQLAEVSCQRPAVVGAQRMLLSVDTTVVVAITRTPASRGQ